MEEYTLGQRVHVASPLHPLDGTVRGWIDDRPGRRYLVILDQEFFGQYEYWCHPVELTPAALPVPESFGTAEDDHDDTLAYREVLDALATAEAALYYIADHYGQRLTRHLTARANISARRVGDAFETLQRLAGESDG